MATINGLYHIKFVSRFRYDDCRWFEMHMELLNSGVGITVSKLESGEIFEAICELLGLEIAPLCPKSQIERGLLFHSFEMPKHGSGIIEVDASVISPAICSHNIEEYEHVVHNEIIPRQRDVLDKIEDWCFDRKDRKKFIIDKCCKNIVIDLEYLWGKDPGEILWSTRHAYSHGSFNMISGVNNVESASPGVFFHEVYKYVTDVFSYHFPFIQPISVKAYSCPRRIQVEMTLDEEAFNRIKRDTNVSPFKHKLFQSMCQQLRKIRVDEIFGKKHPDKDQVAALLFAKDTLQKAEAFNNVIQDAIKQAHERSKTMPASSTSLFTDINFTFKESSQITRVIFNDPATIVFWDDGSKTVVKCQAGDTFDAEKGLAMAIAKKYLGNNYEAGRRFKRWLPKEKKSKKNITKTRKKPATSAEGK